MNHKLISKIRFHIHKTKFYDIFNPHRIEKTLSLPICYYKSFKIFEKTLRTCNILRGFTF